MAWTQSDLDAIEQLIVSGASSVSYEGKSMTARSLDEMLRIRNMIMRGLGMAPSSSTLLVAHRRGYGGGQFDDDGLVSGS